MAEALTVRPVTGIGEVRPGDDLAGLICTAAPWISDGDVLVVTSKVVSKAEGRLVSAPRDPEQRDALRRSLIDQEAVRDVARHGRTRIVETRHGFVMAAAGVDASNVAADELALLPVDSDASALLLRTRIAELLGVGVAVVITDTMGRTWRNGLVDVAIGASGISAMDDYRGRRDAAGTELFMTEIAVIDELAAAGDLVKGKLDTVPVAVVRGLGYTDDGRGVRPLVRPAAEDLFRLGTAEAMQSATRHRREAADFTEAPVEAESIRDAIGSAAVAPVWDPPLWTFDVHDGPPVRVTPRLSAGAGPAALLSLGAAIQNILITASAHGLATRWDAPTEDAPAGTVHIGYPR